MNNLDDYNSYEFDFDVEKRIERLVEGCDCDSVDSAS